MSFFIYISSKNSKMQPQRLSFRCTQLSFPCSYILGSKKRYGKYYRFSAYGKQRIYAILGKRKTQRFLYQTLRSDMAKDSTFDTMQPLIG
jgi:hypothetical protein